MYACKQQQQSSTKMSTKIKCIFISITFEINDIERVSKNLGPNKSPDHDMRSIRMLKLEFIYHPMNLLFKSCVETGQFPLE